MSKLKHTPGPWSKDAGLTKHHIKSVSDSIKGTPIVCKYNDNYKISGDLIVADTLTEEERQANGRLIAAAPEMLDALIAVGVQSEYFEEIGTPTLVKLAIEKATGMNIEEVL